MRQAAAASLLTGIIVGSGCVLDSGPDPADVQLGAIEADDALAKATIGIRSPLVAEWVDPAPVAVAAAAPAIAYHGGPVMLATPNVYLIWYGSWTGNTAQTILPALVTGLSASNYFGINTTYGNAAGAKVSGQLKLGAQYTDAYSRGKALGDSDVAASVAAAITNKKLPTDTNGIYVVLSSADVGETSGFCTAYCGWHTYMTMGASNLKIAFVGNPDRCPTACEAQSVSPNGNAGADGMASVIAHELAEAVTDPNLNAWFDSKGAENADKCAWTWGTTYKAAKGSNANVKLAGKDYLLQRNWLNTGVGACALSK